jgi:hypothetical protein
MTMIMGRTLITGPTRHAEGYGSGHEGCETFPYEEPFHTHTYIKDKIDIPNHHT